MTHRRGEAGAEKRNPNRVLLDSHGKPYSTGSVIGKIVSCRLYVSCCHISIAFSIRGGGNEYPLHAGGHCLFEDTTCSPINSFRLVKDDWKQTGLNIV